MSEEQALYKIGTPSTGTDEELVDGRPILPKKKPAVFKGPGGIDLYDGLAMDLHAINYGEACIKAERKQLLVRIESYAQSMIEGGEGANVVSTVRGLALGLEVQFEEEEKAMQQRYRPGL